MLNQGCEMVEILKLLINTYMWSGKVLDESRKAIVTCLCIKGKIVWISVRVKAGISRVC